MLFFKSSSRRRSTTTTGKRSMTRRADGCDEIGFFGVLVMKEFCSWISG